VALDAVVWPFVGAAIDLFTTSDLDRVRECDSNDRGWVFSTRVAVGDIVGATGLVAAT